MNIISMSFLNKLGKNVKQLVVGNQNLSYPSNPNNTDTFGVLNASVGSKNQTLDGKEAIYPQWFFSARLGQPRDIDAIKIRNFAQSPWVQMVLNASKKQIESMQWDIVRSDEKDETDYTKDIKLIKRFMNNLNDNKQDISEIMSELMTDLGEIDAGVYNFVFSRDSYNISDNVPIYDFAGHITGTRRGLELKPLGKRTLTQIKATSGDSFLKQIDLHKNILRYYQYTFKHPRMNPTPFDIEEIEYLMMNSRTYSTYGFSPVQTLQQVLEVLIQGTRYNKDLYKNSAIPAIIASIPKADKSKLKKLKREWNNEFKNKPHQVGFVSWTIDKFHKLADSNRDLEWLQGQQWYFKLVFAVFGLSPTEAGFFENSNKSNDDGQAKVTVRNAIKPYMEKFSKSFTKRIIPEILQREDTGLKFIMISKDQTQERIRFEQEMIELEKGVITINEYRKNKGLKPYPWGEVPYTSGSQTNKIEENLEEDSKDKDKDKDKDKKELENKKRVYRELYKARTEGFLKGCESRVGV